MAFDPDAYLASSPAPAGGGFDPDAYLATAPSTGTSALMGAGNAASFGFNDEAGGFLGALGEKTGISGLVSRAFGNGDMPEVVRAQTREGAPIANAAADAQDAQTFGDRYRANRDEIRNVDQAAREANPWAYHGAGIAASVANPLGVAARGASFGTRMAAAGAAGIASGAGNSEADLTEGDFGGYARDALIGGAAGAGTAGVLEAAGAGIRKVVGGAQGRQNIRNVDALLEKTPAVRTQDKANAILGGKEGISKTLKSTGLEKYVRDAKGGLELADEKLTAVGDDIGSIYAKVDQARPGGVAKAEEVYDRLGHLLDKYAENRDVAKFSALKTRIGELRGMDEFRADRAAPGFDGGDTMTASQLFELKKNLGNIGYGAQGAPIASKDAKQAARDATEIVRDFLAERVDGATGEAAKLDKLNKQWRELHTIRDVFEAKAKRDDRMAPSLGERFKEFVQKPITMTAAAGAGATALSHGNLAGAAMGLAPAAIAALPYAARGADALLIPLANAAKRTGDPAGLIRRAVSLGIPEETASAIVRSGMGGGSPPAGPSGFDQWYAGMAAQKGLDPNPDAPEHFYDYRSYYRDQGGTPDGHFPSRYKTAGHPREFLADSNGRIFNTRTGTYVEDGSAVSPAELDGAEYAPDLRQRVVR